MAVTQYYNLTLFPDSTDASVRDFRLTLAGDSDSNMTKIAAALHALDIGKATLPTTGAADGKVLKASVTGDVVTLVWGDSVVTVDTAVTETGVNPVSSAAIYNFVMESIADFYIEMIGDFSAVATQMETLIGEI